MKIHLWAPELAQGGGGIEVYSADCLQGLLDLFGEGSVAVFTKSDTTAQLHRRWGSTLACRGSGNAPKPLRTLAFLASIASAAIRDRPDLIVSTHVNFGPAAVWLKRMVGSRYLLTLHGIDVWGLQHKGRQNGIAKADLIVPISGYTAERVIEEQGISRERVRILPCVANAEGFHVGPKPEYLLRRYGLTPEQPVILTVGRLSSTERYKGHDRVLRVLKDVTEQVGRTKDEVGSGSKTRYLIVGNGDDRARLEALADELAVRELVIFAGKVPAGELDDHYNLCDLFAMPSTGEGFGIVFLEALACGKPVIAGNKDASRDAVMDGELGVLVDPDDPQELTRALVAVLAEVENRKAKVESKSRTSELRPVPSGLRIPEIVFQPEALRAKVIEHFGYEKFKQRLGEILEPVLEKLKD